MPSRRSSERPPRHVQDTAGSGRRVRRWVGLSALAVVLVVLGAGAWLAAKVWTAKGELERAQEGLSAVAEGNLADGVAVLADTVHDAHQHTRRARAATTDALWGVAEHLPWLGPNLTVMRQVTEAADDVLATVEPLADVARDLEPSRLVPVEGRIPLEPLHAAAPAMLRAAEELRSHQDALAAIDTAGTVAQLAAARTLLADMCAKATDAITTALPLVELAPELLGASGPRTYVVMFLNNAELRSLGGSALSFAELAVDDGALDLVRVTPAGDRNFPERFEPLLPVPEGFETLWPGGLGRFIPNATLRPSQVTAAQIVAAEWATQFGVEPDGVIAVDGGALRLLLGAVEPFTLSTGDVVDGTTVVPLLLNEVYRRYSTGDAEADDAAQSAVYAEAVGQTFARIVGGQFDPVALFSAAGTAAAERRMSVWLRDEAEAGVLAGTAFAATGVLPSTEAQDVVGVYLNDSVGTKLNYYLESSVQVGSAACMPDGRVVRRIMLRATNLVAPEDVPGLTPSLLGHLWRNIQVPAGMQRIVVLVYAPPGSQFLDTHGVDAMVDMAPYVDEGHPVRRVIMHLPPGETRDLVVDVAMGTPGRRELRLDITPTVQGTPIEDVPLDCGTVAIP